MSQKLIIFDMDGTLVNSSLTIANAINYVRQNLGFEPMPQEHILNLVNDHTINPAQTFYHAKTFEPDHERWFSEYYTRNHEKELVLYEGIKELLESLKEQGHALAIATNAYRGSTIESLTHLNVYEHFDAIACYDDVPRGKPHPDMLYKILDELDHSKEKSLFIGDGPRDEMASKRANIPYIMVDWGFTDHSNAVRSVSDLKGILLS
ncbi:HAD family hydrolase [Sulfurovum sp.]|uniref:HAD family hydrolase n=1 Tax=Sulfurovum sp. TaxID=1969726 RepID=UPI0025E78BC4|nr:HAD family hydrolase [Sulfurovum sp.]